MNYVEMRSTSSDHLVAMLDGARIQRVKEFHAKRTAAGWDIQFVVDPEPAPVRNAGSTESNAGPTEVVPLESTAAK